MLGIGCGMYVGKIGKFSGCWAECILRRSVADEAGRDRWCRHMQARRGIGATSARVVDRDGGDV